MQNGMWPISRCSGHFCLQPSAKTKSQFDVVKSLIAQAELVVHAGDPDDEGQLLVDEVIEYCRFNGPVKRVLINDLNTAAAAKALSNLRDNKELEGFTRKQSPEVLAIFSMV